MKIAVIGYGSRAKGVFGIMKEIDQNIELCSVCDVKSKEELCLNDVNYYEDAEEMLDKEKPDGVIVGTRCSMHTKMAIKVLKRRIPLFLEKPVSTSFDDLYLLEEEYKKEKSPVVVSFPLRTSLLVKLAKEIIDSGKIGTVEHIQAVNNVPYGGVYYHSWYRDEMETGGLFLQKATHDFDYINYLSGANPVEICAVKSKQIFKGDKPTDLMCKDCKDNHDCPESPLNLRNAKENIMGDWCCFAKDTGNEDSSSALILYDSGMHASYSQNFFARKSAASRGARFLGYKGTLEFDWYTNVLKVHLHHRPITETHAFDTSKDSHFGGDYNLAANFLKVIRGEEASQAPLEAGILSALMCLHARESSLKREFRKIR